MEVRLNFGCGIDKRDGFVNVDFKDFDFNKYPYPYKNNTFDYVLVRDVLEHLDEPLRVLDELYRICKSDAVIEVIVPYYNSAGAYNSLEHKHFFNRMTFEGLDNDFKGNHLNLQTTFKVNKLTLNPTRLGKLIPNFIREKASFVIGEVYNSINCELKVVK